MRTLRDNGQTGGMTSPVTSPLKTAILRLLGLASAILGIYVANAHDAPGAAGLGWLLMVVGVALGVRAARNGVPVWAARTTFLGGVVIAAVAATPIHRSVVTGPLFAQGQEKNLPGVSVAVGVGDALVWAEGFGWRDVGTHTPPPESRFNIGTAAREVAAAVAPLGLTHTGAEAAKAWSPEAIGEEGEDFPPHRPPPRRVAAARIDARRVSAARRSCDVLCAEFRPGPRSRTKTHAHARPGLLRGRHAFYSTPTDLVRFGLAASPGIVNGELAGGLVMSLTTERDSGIVVAGTSNLAGAGTASLARAVAEAFAEELR